MSAWLFTVQVPFGNPEFWGVRSHLNWDIISGLFFISSSFIFFTILRIQNHLVFQFLKLLFGNACRLNPGCGRRRGRPSCGCCSYVLLFVVVLFL